MRKILSLVMMLFMALLMPLYAQNALVIVAHGAPSKIWNVPVMKLEKNVQEELKSRGITGFSYVRVALMEFTEPSVSTVIHDCEQQKVEHIFVLPLFISPSSHSEQDVPNILGLKYNVQTLSALSEEGTKLVHTNIPITIGPTLSYGTVIQNIITDRIKELSIGKTNVSFVLLAHGDPEYLPFWQQMIQNTGDTVAQRTGVSYAGYAFVGMGQHFYQDLLPVAQNAAKTHKTILLQGIYLANGVKGMSMIALTDKKQKKYQEEMPKEADFVYGTDGLLPDTRVCKWIVDRAVEWLKRAD